MNAMKDRGRLDENEKEMEGKRDKE